ncbi:MAG: DUF4293 domain-containing protein [Bacteroidales bacterium]|nr:DUF4293 domain-containing protein [Candidatus Colimorpha merdihippi]
MIQRKQTLFLLIAVAAMVLCFVFPTATFTAKAPLGIPVAGELNLIPKAQPDLLQQITSGNPIEINQRDFINTWPNLVLTLLVAAIAMVSIFLYKKRTTQMKVVAVDFLLCVLDIFLIFIWTVDSYVKKATETIHCTDIDTHYTLATWLPIVAVVFLFLAQRSIKSDEEKVRAADRLR